MGKLISFPAKKIIKECTIQIPKSALADLIQKNGQLQRALDEAQMDNLQLSRLCAQMAGTWTDEEEARLEQSAQLFESKYPGGLSARTQQAAWPQ